MTKQVLNPVRNHVEGNSGARVDARRSDFDVTALTSGGEGCGAVLGATNISENMYLCTYVPV